MKLKPTKQALHNAHTKLIPDIIAPNLKILFCGINPGLYSAATGYHFARPGNRFWKSLYQSGITPRLFDPSEQKQLLELKLGITNVVQRSSATAAEVSPEEFKKGGEILIKKVLKYKPKILAIVGLGAYKTAFNKPKAKISLQQEKIGGTIIWVLPNPSGLNANYSQDDFNRLFKKLLEQVK